MSEIFWPTFCHIFFITFSHFSSILSKVIKIMILKNIHIFKFVMIFWVLLIFWSICVLFRKSIKIFVNFWSKTEFTLFMKIHQLSETSQKFMSILYRIKWQECQKLDIYKIDINLFSWFFHKSWKIIIQWFIDVFIKMMKKLTLSFLWIFIENFMIFVKTVVNFQYPYTWGFRQSLHFLQKVVKNFQFFQKVSKNLFLMKILKFGFNILSVSGTCVFLYFLKNIEKVLKIFWHFFEKPQKKFFNEFFSKFWWKNRKISSLGHVENINNTSIGGDPPSQTSKFWWKIDKNVKNIIKNR